MTSKTLFVYSFYKLFKILDEIKENLNFKVYHIDEKDLSKLNFNKFDKYLVITDKTNIIIKNSLILKNFPEKIVDLVEKINLSFLKNQFIEQSSFKVGKYILDLNSKKIIYGETSLNLTEKECRLIMFINEHKKASSKELEKNVWSHSTYLETHTVETHIYRLRKKMSKIFDDENFIDYDHGKYFFSKNL